MLLLLPSPSWAPKRCICRRSIGWWLCRLVRCDATGSRLLLSIGQWPPRLPEASTRMLAGKTCATTAQYLSYCSAHDFDGLRAALLSCQSRQPTTKTSVPRHNLVFKGWLNCRRSRARATRH